ncbi:type I-C CRISPR-associated endonuclease Cas1c [Aeoliella sp.]|uniref:type I-C CRISPR-associated endonuclease Cas1c n=1 Tax=Aeoliella sp. TaxID=2795800 RepID=UPI003CCBF0C0
MKTHLNTLFVTTQGSYLAKDGEAVAVRVDKQPRLRIPLHNLDGIVAFGQVGCSPALMAAAAGAGVTISMLSEHGRFLASIVGYTSGNVLLRREQYRRADDIQRTLSLARAFVVGKVVNCRAVLLRAARDAAQGDRKDALTAAAKRLAGRLIEINQAETVDILRGLEGEAATQYFAAFPQLLTQPSPGFEFTKRTRRPPTDPINALMSFVYTLLLHDVRSACEATGLDAAVGYLHRDRPGRPGLALDLMEEFRPYLADRLVFSLINRGQVSPKGFQTQETGGVVMDDTTRKQVLVSWQERKQEEIKHPFTGDRMTVGLLPHLQARILARHLRGDLDAYPPFVWK